MNVLDNIDYVFDLSEENISSINCNRAGFDKNDHSKIRTSHLDFHKNTYKLNNLNFRDEKDLISGKPADILTLGCSQTFGIGLPQEYIWPFLIEKKMNRSVSNLGMSGASAKMISDLMLYYFKNVGLPKVVIANFPDTFRYSHLLDGEIYAEAPNKNSTHFKLTDRPPFQTITFLKNVDYGDGEIYIKDKYVKFPADAADIIPAH